MLPTATEFREVLSAGIGALDDVVDSDGNFRDSLAAAESLVILIPWISAWVSMSEDELWEQMGTASGLSFIVARVALMLPRSE